MKQNTQQIRIASKNFTSNSLLKVTAIIETNGEYAKDIIFLALCSKDHNGYKTDNCITMQITSIDLKAIAFSIQEAVQKNINQPVFEKFTKSSSTKKLIIYGNCDQGFLKNISLIINKSAYNMQHQSQIFFERYNALSVADTFLSIARELESFLFRYQRMDKNS